MASPQYENRMSGNLADIVGRIESRAQALGLSITELSRRAGSSEMVRNWQRALRKGSDLHPRLDTLAAVAAVLGVELNWLLHGTGAAPEKPGQPAPGFHEAATPFTFREPEPGSASPSPSLSAIFGAAALTPASYRIMAEMPGFDLRPGDIIVVDLSRLPQPGELCLVTAFDDQTASSMSTVRRYAPPFLLAGNSTLSPSLERVDNPNLTVRYPVVGSIRGCPPTA